MKTTAVTPPVSLHRIPKPNPLAAQDASFGVLDRPVRYHPTKEHPLIVSVSEIKNFKRCRVRHHWTHQCRLERLERALPLAIGTFGHEILERWYALPLIERTQKTMEKIARKQAKVTDEKSLSTDDLELVIAMTVGYAGWAKREDALIGVGDHVLPELWAEVPLTPDADVLLRVKIDTVFESTKFKKTVGHHEHKFVGRIETGVFEQAEQISGYQFALRYLYPKMSSRRSYPNLLRKQLPGPRVTADLFARTEEERTDEQLDQWGDDTRRVALDMLGAAVYPNPTKDCSWDCDFRNPCLLRGQPDELKTVLDDEYQVRKEYTK